MAVHLWPEGCVTTHHHGEVEEEDEVSPSGDLSLWNISHQIFSNMLVQLCVWADGHLHSADGATFSS